MSRGQGHSDNPALQRRLAELERMREQRMRDRLKAVLSTVEGRAFCYQLIDDVQVLGDYHSTNHSLNDHWFGRRSVGADLVKRIQDEFPAKWREMLNEASRLAEHDANQRKAAIAGAASTMAADEGADEEQADG